jgi:glycine cleavage system H protein
MTTVQSYEFPGDCWYDPREHLWVRPEPGAPGGPGGRPDGAPALIVTIGIDALGQELLGEAVYVQLAEPGTRVGRGEAMGSLEAEKMVRAVLAPLTGVVHELNPALLAEPRLLNTAPYEAGWLLRMHAAHWEVERPDLLHDEAAVAAWARAEIEASRADPRAPGADHPAAGPGSRRPLP